MRFILAILTLATTGIPREASAHKLNTSYTTLVVSADTLKVRVRFDDFDMMKIGLDKDGDGLLFYEEMEAGLEQTSVFAQKHLQLHINGEPVTLKADKGDITPDNKGNMFANLYWGAPLAEPTQTLKVRVDWPGIFGDDHKNLVKILMPDQPLVQAVFSVEKPEQSFGAADQPTLMDQIFEFIVLGVEHILIGYDHVMFLLALIAVGGRLMNLIKIVTAFTIAHSITLCLAALGWVSLPGKWIEAGIALSIAYVAVENFWIQRTDRRWMLTFVFGLVHGFGFANVLRDLGLPTRGLVASLFSFNIGVEIGQVAIVAIAYPLIAWLNRQTFQRPVVLAISALIGLFGLGWFVERVFDLEYMPL